MFPSVSSQQVRTPRLVRPLVFRGRASIALRFARLFPCVQVIVFEDDWLTVDRARAAAESLGLSDRVHIHHVSACVAGVDLPTRPVPRRTA